MDEAKKMETSEEAPKEQKALIRWIKEHKKEIAIAALEKSIGDGKEEASNLDLFSLEMFENIAFIMAKYADRAIPDAPEEWLDRFNTFSIYQVLPQLIELWGLNVKNGGRV